MGKEMGFPNCLCQTWRKAAMEMMKGEWQIVNGERTTQGGGGESATSERSYGWQEAEMYPYTFHSRPNLQ